MRSERRSPRRVAPPLVGATGPGSARVCPAC